MILRGPFDFLGSWIQNAPFLPIEINIPDTFASVGGAVGSAAQNVGMFAQGVGTNLNSWFQNAGQGFHTFTQNMGSHLQNVTHFFGQRPSTTPSTAEEPQPESGPDVQQVLVTEQEKKKYFILIPMDSSPGNNKKESTRPVIKEKDISFDGDIFLDTYP